MRILVTGASGRVGRNLLLDGLAEHHEVTALDKAPPLGNLVGVRYVEGSVLNRESLSRAMEEVEGVIHLAGIPYDVPPLHQVFEVNLQGTYNTLEAAVDQGVRHFLHMSSIMTYGFGRNASPQYLPVDEVHPALSHDTYGMSKLLGEALCRSFTMKYGIRTLCFRLTHFTSFSRPYPDRFPYQENEGIEGLHQYIESRDLVTLLNAGLGATAVSHDVFLATAADSGHLRPTPEIIAESYPQAELRYSQLRNDSPFVSMEKCRRILGFSPLYSWRGLKLDDKGSIQRQVG